MPVLVGDDWKAVFLWKALYDAGVYVNVAIYPAVQRGGALLRTSVMATHEKEHLDRALAVFERVKGTVDGIEPPSGSRRRRRPRRAPTPLTPALGSGLVQQVAQDAFHEPARLAGRSTPSSPKPNIRPKSVTVTAASSNGTRSDWIQSLTFVDGPAGCAPGIDQPPRSPGVSNEVSLTSSRPSPSCRRPSRPGPASCPSPSRTRSKARPACPCRRSGRSTSSASRSSCRSTRSMRRRRAGRADCGALVSSVRGRSR